MTPTPTVERKPVVGFRLVRGDVIPPWIWDGKDWIRYPSPEADELSRAMAAEYEARFGHAALGRGGV